MGGAKSQSNRKRSFEASYRTADVAEQYIRNKLHEHQFIPRQLGMDRRYEELPSEEIEGKPDLLLQKSNISVSGRTDCGYIEIKSKQNEDWMYICNQYQWEKYVDFATTRSEPLFIGWFLVDDEDRRIYDEQYVKVNNFEQVERAFTAPDGNTVVVINDDDAVSFNKMKQILLKEVS